MSLPDLCTGLPITVLINDRGAYLGQAQLYVGLNLA